MLHGLAVRGVDLGPPEHLLPLERGVVPAQILRHGLDLHRPPELRVLVVHLDRVGDAGHHRPRGHLVEEPAGPRTA